CPINEKSHEEELGERAEDGDYENQYCFVHKEIDGVGDHNCKAMATNMVVMRKVDITRIGRQIILGIKAPPHVSLLGAKGQILKIGEKGLLKVKGALS
ncbi:hypothetical protein HAX54_050525, partial [Datura stramonium]|nr:hypothetical protein [Datura stramonium]